MRRHHRVLEFRGACLIEKKVWGSDQWAFISPTQRAAQY
jgi:hypothetical protein